MIALRDVSFTYEEGAGGGLRDVSLEVPRGQCLLLCGASGCGKTTLTRLLNGLIPHFFRGRLSGRATVAGMDLASGSLAGFSGAVGSVFQNPRTQFFNTDTDSEIVFGLENRGWEPERMRRRLEDVTAELGIAALRGRSIFELSGGEKQKVAFASVYAAHPELFVLDEPSSNLDMPSVAALAALLRGVKEQGKTIVIAEHRLWYLMDIADRVVCMAEGGIVADMRIADFRALPAERGAALGLRCRELPALACLSEPPRRAGPRLTLRALSVVLGGRSVLKSLSFAVEGGEIVALAGANGAGKTTLARTLCGLARERSGQVALDGAALSGKERRAKAYMVMQDVGHQLFTDSVEAECRLGAQEADAALIEEALERLDLAPLRLRHPLSLSGGQKQRLAVAVSLICRREILIFDEPTSGLDLKGMREVGDLARRLAESGKILLIITHDVEFIMSLCTRVLILSEGELIADLRGEEKSALTRWLLGGEGDGTN